MSFPKYPKYKDSGVEWLGEVPEHWQQIPVWLLFDIGRGRVISHEEILDNPGDYPVYSSQTENQGVMGYLSSFEFEGDFLTWTTDGANAGTVFRRSGRFNCTNVCGTLKPKTPIVSLDYCRHALAISTAYFVRHDINPKLMNNVMAKIRILIPSIDEQSVIAEFLDRETSKIDSLVAEQRRLIELLKEKRQAVISHAVTKGLNPHAPMKPSGIEWLGDVPEHWDVMKGSAIGALFGSEQVPDESVSDEGDLPFIKVGSMSLHSFEIESWDWYVDAAVAQHCNARAGYIVFPKRGAAIFTNKVNIVHRPSMIDPNLMGWEIGPKAVPKFMAYTLKCRKLDELADVSTVPQINNKHISPERFPIPTLNEQREIVEFLDTETSKLNSLTAEAERAIELLQERRTALISAAVTGKIDVRHLVEVN
ncbi:MAG: restriction endonuclease subunit S [Planctomyces sp.]